MKATIEREACIGCGLCSDLCPEVFELDDENIATVIAQPDASTEENAKEAGESCPTDAITVE